MDSCLLFHGPGARQHAIDDANRRGRLIHDPFGDDGLKVDEAREFVGLLQVAPSCRETGIVIAGPMDKAQPKSADVLLKAIEEFSPMVLPILWATDIGGVRNTIRSRCLPIWAPATGFEPVDEEVEATARGLLHAALNDRVAEIPALVARVKSDSKKKIPGREFELVAEVADAMAAMSNDPRVRVLWEKLRKLARWRNPTQLEIIATFLPGSD